MREVGIHIVLAREDRKRFAFKIKVVRQVVKIIFIAAVVVFCACRILASAVSAACFRTADEHRYDELVLDDAGAEPLFNFYGDKMEILPYILDKRMESPCRTHMTGNLTPKEMGRRYGARVADRFVEMFSYHQFGGTSHRTLRPNADIRRAQVAALAAMKPKDGDFLPSGLTPPDENAQNRATGTPRINPQGENGETTAPEARSA